MTNTTAILEQGGNSGTAAEYAYEYINGGKSDWHLPSKDELNELCKYARMQTTGNTTVTCDSSGTRRIGFTLNTYWSSSEEYAATAWQQLFEFGIQGTNLKARFPARVRPVRAF